MTAEEFGKDRKLWHLDRYKFAEAYHKAKIKELYSNRGNLTAAVDFPFCEDCQEVECECEN